MHGFLFLRALFSGWATAMMTLVSLLSLISFLTGIPGLEKTPTGLRLVVACFAIVGAAYRIWRKEYRQPGPKIVLECNWNGESGSSIRTVRDTEFILLNDSEESAFSVKIEDIVRSCGAAKFEVVSKVLKGTSVSVKPIIEWSPPKSVLLQHDFMSLLRKEWEQKGVDAANFDTTRVLVTIVYKNIHGQEFETRQEIEHRHISCMTTVHHRGYRRRYRSFAWASMRRLFTNLKMSVFGIHAK